MNTSSNTERDTSPKPAILIVGTGAIGSFYGGKLAQAGARVSTVCRSDYDVVKAEGIGVKSIWGDFQFVPEKVVRHAGECGPVDYVIVTTKVVPDADVPSLVKTAVGKDTAIVLIQNGIEIEKPVADAFPHNEIISGLAFIAVTRVGPGQVHHQDYGRLTIGSFPSGTSEKVKILARLFSDAGVPCEHTSDVVTARWQKLVWNASFNPISVLGGGVDTQTILASEESEKLVRKTMEEVCLVAKAVGHELPSSVIGQNIDGTLAMKPYKTSMLLDHEAKRPMEVEAIMGNAVRAARRSGVSVPRLESLYALLQLTDRKIR